MKNRILIILLSLLVLSCGTRRNVSKRNTSIKTVKKTSNLKILNSDYSGKTPSNVVKLLKDAEKYLGTPYKYAGNTASGFDCSGFTCKVFAENKQTLPRRSQDQAKEGHEINIKNVKPGDLLFFATSGGKSVSHVGIVHDIGNNGEVRFIHASTSKGVVISSLNEKYWNNAYLFARRIL
ncbi:MAG: C40 family peptidase [Flavobacteriaceae bacterium]|jgi:cell wall-associated NlpC family hydrolase|nr:C40 family peptidase [Flavobacteriaceae bacterium]